MTFDIIISDPEIAVWRAAQEGTTLDELVGRWAQQGVDGALAALAPAYAAENQARRLALADAIIAAAKADPALQEKLDQVAAAQALDDRT